MKGKSLVVWAAWAGWAALALVDPARGEDRQPAPREVRTWTSTSGATEHARLVFNYGNWVVLEAEDGSQLKIRTVFLCDEDMKYLNGLRADVWINHEKPPEPERLDLNSASLAELKFLPRVGEVTAKMIVKRRPFKRPSELLEIPGIGEKTYDLIKDDVTVKPIRKANDEDGKR